MDWLEIRILEGRTCALNFCMGRICGPTLE
jgi:hypothetical protein